MSNSLLTSGGYGNPADYLVTDAVIASDSTINAELPGQQPGTIVHTAGYAVMKEKGLDGTWTEIE